MLLGLSLHHQVFKNKKDLTNEIIKSIWNVCDRRIKEMGENAFKKCFCFHNQFVQFICDVLIEKKKNNKQIQFLKRKKN